MPSCKHPYLQVEEFTSLGQVVSCTECEKTFHLAEDIGEKYYLPFVYTIPGKGDREIAFFIHHSKVKS